MRRNMIVVLTLCVAGIGTGGAETQDPITRISEADLKADIFTLAGDAMRGREGGTLDEMAASAWVAERARAAGLQPAGDNGTFFQFFPLERFRVSPSCPVTLGGKALRMGRDVIPDATVLADVDAPVVVSEASALAGVDVKGKTLVVRYQAAAGSIASALPNQSAPNAAPALRTWARNVQRSAAPQAPAAVVVLVPDEYTDQWDRTAITFPRGTYGLDPDGTADQRIATRGVPLLYVRESALGGPLAPDAKLVASIFTDSFQYPSVNVIGKVPGRDPALASQYVLFSAHQDHDGERYAVNGDDIWNGADDNASTAVALLAIGRAVSASPLRRSALFIWHGSEERGLMGSRWYVKHPTVPLSSIVACLNGDLIGRNDPGTAALLGALPPHRNSPELVDMALAANKAVSNFIVDSSWDDPNHREGWYYRSDHLSYARAGVPAIFFTTLLHADYHTPFDNPDRIDIAKLARMTRWMYATGRAVADADKAPAVDPNFKLERCRDSTGNYCGG
jgi:Peptidase family M28